MSEWGNEIEEVPPMPAWRLSVATLLARAAIQLTALAAAILPYHSPERAFLSGDVKRRKEIHKRYSNAASDKRPRRESFMIALSILLAGWAIAGALAGFPVIHFIMRQLGYH